MQGRRGRAEQCLRFPACVREACSRRGEQAAHRPWHANATRHPHVTHSFIRSISRRFEGDDIVLPGPPALSLALEPPEQAVEWLQTAPCASAALPGLGSSQLTGWSTSNGVTVRHAPEDRPGGSDNGLSAVRSPAPCQPASGQTLPRRQWHCFFSSSECRE